MKFIELNRRFRNITEEELEHPELLAAFGEQLYNEKTDDWAKLLESRRVVLLAEAGSGKTEEMQAQVNKLKTEKKNAFYADLASLDRESLSDLLSTDDEHTFAAWKAEHDTPAWFFLDSIDELKLTQGKLHRALNRFAKDVHGLLHRAYVIISCRPSDWKFDLDLQAVQEVLPVVAAAPDSADLTGEELFLAPFRRDEERQKEKKSDDETDAVLTVIMLPLTRRQIESYARSCSVQDAEAFMVEIQRQEAWLFANRPLDCGNLVQMWNAKGKLGTRVEQHKANIAAKLKDDPERSDNNLLTPEEAREGAERLALALALTRTRTVLAPGHEAAEGVLDSAAILTNWTPAKRNALLRRGLFDPATYGRIRFHHRSVEEYLAACRLKGLREKGMSINALKRFFFAEKYEAKVVIPSMRPIAAWLALWNDEIRWELVKREPEVLLAYGDPGSLSTEARAEVLRGFAAAYGDGGWRGVDAPSIGEVRRLASPELAPVIRELWKKYSASEEVVKLLLQLIWQGAIKDCVDIAENAAHNVKRSKFQRGIAVFALDACGESAALRKIAESVLTEQEKWPDEIIPELSQRLFPAALSVQELILLIKRTPQPESVISGFAWHLERIAEDIDHLSVHAVELRKAIAELVWHGRDNSRQEFSKYSYLSSGLAKLCDKQLAAEKIANDNLVWSCAVANRFGTHGKLKGYFENNTHIREKAFWIEAELLSQLFSGENYNKFYAITENSLLGQGYNPFGTDDRKWLMNTLGNSSSPVMNREIAYEAIFHLWNLNGRLEIEAEDIRQAVADNAFFSDKFKQDITPKPKKEPKWQRRARRKECVRKGRERQRVEKCQKWRKELLTDTEAAFSSERVFSTLRDLHHWLERYHLAKTDRSGDVWNKDVITQTFSSEVTSRVVESCKAIWRNEPPVLWSNRPEESRNKCLYVWKYALFGLAEESSSPGWTKRLTDDEVQRAAVYATFTWENFPPWFEDLAKEHPKAVESILGDELERQVAMSSDHKELRLLHHLSNASSTVKKLLAPRLAAILPNWPDIFSKEEVANFARHHLDWAFKILDETARTEERASLAAECAIKLHKNPNGPLACSWLRGVFLFDPLQGVHAIEETLNAVNESERTEQAVRLFANGTSPRLFEITDQTVRANALKRLLLCARTYIRPEQDNVHDEGVYTPDARDDAQHVRSRLLESLIATPGAEAHKIILDLADNPLFAHFPDRLRLLAREQAAKDAEFAPYIPDDLVALEKKFEAPPRNRDELFAAMMDRFDDIQHDIAHHDFNIRQTLCSITDEEEMQRYLAKEFDVKANGAYTVVRENEKADRKRTDIQLNAVHGEQKAVIEIKLAIKDRWKIKDFQSALRHQLVGQYLRHETCKAGCLLLTCNGSKKYWEHPETKEQVYFPELIKLLQAEAEAIEQEKNHEIRLAVFGLDLTDPHLEPAHK